MPKLDPRTATAAISAALLVATPLVAKWEGKSNTPYYDLVNRATVCFGETNVPMRRYSNAECEAMLNGSLRNYAIAVVERNPELLGHPNQLAAAVSLSYNIGSAAYARSTVAKRFSAGDWKGACDAFLAWSYAGGKRVVGLVRRREAERAVCRSDLP